MVARFVRNVIISKSLEILDIGNNTLKDLNGLQFCNLKELKILKAYRNEITKIEFLENLK